MERKNKDNPISFNDFKAFMDAILVISRVAIDNFDSADKDIIAGDLAEFGEIINSYQIGNKDDK